jgi:hypothetical protein
MKTTLAAYGSAITGLLAFLAALPYTLGDAATIFPPEWKARIAVTSAIAAAILKIIQGHVSQDAPKAVKDEPAPTEAEWKAHAAGRANP